MVVASQVIAPASSGGLFSDSSIVASAEGAQQYEVSPGQDSDAGTVIKIDDPDESGTTYTATAKNGYRFVKFVYDNEMSGEQEERYSNQIHFGEEEAYLVSNLKAVFLKVSDSTYNVTANTGLKYTGEEQALVETTGTGGTIGYAKVPDGKSVGDVVKRDGGGAIVPEVGKVYTPDLNGSQGGQNGVSFDSSYRVAVDGTYYTSGGTNYPVRLRYSNSLKKYQIYDADGYHDIKDGCNAILVTNVDDTTKVITGTLVNSADYVSPSELSWNTTVPTATDVGDYTVAWKVDGNDEYKSKAVSTVKTSIAKGDSTINVTAKSGLAYDGDEQELVETTGAGGTVSYAVAPEGKSVGDVVKRDVWEAIVPEVGKVYTPDLNGSEYGKYGVLLDPSYSVIVDNQGYTQGGDFNPVRLMYDNDSEKYQIVEYDGSQDTSVSRDIKDGCNAILVTDVDKAHNVIVGTFVNSADYVSSDSLTWSEDIPTGTAAGSYDVYWKVVGDDNYNGKDAAKVTATIAGADAQVTIEGKDFVVADSTGKTVIDPTTPAQEPTEQNPDGTPAVYTLSNGDYIIYSNETLATTDGRFDMSVGTKGYNFGNKAYKYRYKVEISDINNGDDISDDITLFHAHEVAVSRSDSKEAVIADCVGENDDYYVTLARFDLESQ